MRDEEQFSDECLTDGEFQNPLLLEEPIGSMLTVKAHVFSDSVFCAGPWRIGPNLCLKIGKKTELLVKSDTCKNSNDIASQLIDIECVLETCLCKYCASYKSSCRRPGMNFRVFQTGSSSRAGTSTSPTGKVRSVCLRDQSETWIMLFLGPGSEKTWKTMKNDHLTSLHTVNWTELVLSVRTYFKQVHWWSEREKWSWNPFQKRVRQSSHAREYDFGVQSFFRRENSDPAQDAKSDSNLHSRIDAGRNHSVSSPQTSFLAVCERSSTTNSRFVQWVTMCLSAIRRFVPWGDHVLLESRKEQVQEPPEPTQRKLLMRTSQEARLSKTVDVGQFFRTSSMLMDVALRRVANNWPDHDLFWDPRS